MSPMAPFGDRARGLKADSAWMTARTKSALSACWLALASMRSSKTAARADPGFVVAYDVALVEVLASVVAATVFGAPARPKTRYVLAAGSRGWSDTMSRPDASVHEYSWACASEGVSAQSAAAMRTGRTIFPWKVN